MKAGKGAYRCRACAAWCPAIRICAIRACDAQGRPLDRSVSGFHARVVQHEVDHLDGILYPRRIRDLTQFGFTDTLFPGQDLADD